MYIIIFNYTGKAYKTITEIFEFEDGDESSAVEMYNKRFKYWALEICGSVDASMEDIREITNCSREYLGTQFIHESFKGKFVVCSKQSDKSCVEIAVIQKE